MNSFPKHIHADNIPEFHKINYERIVGLFRKETYDTLLTRKDENVYIDLDTFSRKYCNNKSCVINKIVESVSEELRELGWKTKLSFGDTGLFIYSTENPPISCW
jgi:hypothetical protein